MPMNLPTLADLQATYGYGDPSVYSQAAANQDLARQYAQQEVQQAQNKTQEGTLKNLFDAEQNPQLIQQRGLENIGLGNKNITEGVAARRAAANEGMQLSEDQRKFALTATQQDLDMADKWAEGEIRSGDPRRMQEARKILDFSSAARAAKALSDTAMERQQEQSRASKYSADTSAAASRYGTDSRANMAAAKTKGTASIEELVRSGKMTAEKAAVALHGAAMFEPDPKEVERLSTMARQYEQLAMQLKNAQAEGKLNLGAQTGLPTRNLPSAFGNSSSAPQMTAQDQAALEWANANPNDPRAAKIKQKLGK